MKKITKVCVLAFFFMTSFAAHAVELTEESVKELILQSEKAAEAKNASMVADLLSDDVKITMNLEIQGQKQTMNMNKQQYIAMLKQGWAVAADYTYSRSNQVIKIEGSKALVKADVKESMAAQGQKITTTTKEESTIEIVGGKLLLTNLKGNAKLEISKS